MRAHRIYILSLVFFVCFTTYYLTSRGLSYYGTSIEERFYHPDHDLFKPSGVLGHGLGIIGTAFILIGVILYMLRKRWRLMSRWGRVKHWLEFHIFLCVLGPIMVLFHTAFKFGGIVSISFWSMVVVVLSGIIGRYLYLQIPRTISGREMSLAEIVQTQTDLNNEIRTKYSLEETDYNHIKELGSFSKMRSRLEEIGLPKSERGKIIKLIKSENSLNHRISRLQTMQKLFRYWHIAHLPFAIIMIIIMVIHIAITITFGARWIF